MKDSQELQQGLDEIAAIRQRHAKMLERGDLKLVPQMERMEGLALTSYLASIDPGMMMDYLAVMAVDRREVVPALVFLAHSIGYMRALEDLRQERVSI